jgi:hypothetical protein
VKKTVLISSLVLMLMACSVSDVSNILAPLATTTPLPSATKTIYVTPSNTPTITATQPTPTFTGTPTLIGAGFTETPSLPPPPTSAYTAPASTSGVNSIFTPQYVGFISVQVSGNILRWGGCEPSSLTFTARVVDPIKVASVTLWIRLSNPPSGEETKWEAGAIMNGDNTGTYTYTLVPKNISHYDEFPNAWLQYQLVAKDANFNDVGRTQPYLNNVTLARC